MSALAGTSFIATPAHCGLSDFLFSTHDDDSQPSQSLQDVVSQWDSGDAAVPVQDRVRTQLKAFYEARNYTLAWSGDVEAAARASEVKSALEHAEQQGLRSKDYTSGLARWSDAPESGRDAAEFDVAMTEALLRYAFDVRVGRVDPHSVYKDVGLPANDFDAAAELSNALGGDGLTTFLADLPPPHPGYRWLVEALARYRTAAQSGWPTMSEKSGTSALAQRLAFEDPALAETAVPSQGDLKDALLRFQQRNGLEISGKLGPDTLKALNVPASYRVQEIIANMERWRWVPRQFENRYILVNVPDQSLDFVESQTSRLHSKVVVGKKTTQTPIMRTAVEAVVANPPWDVPDDIAARRFLSHLRRNKNYLTSQNLVLAGLPGSPHLEQTPGPNNAMGRVMLDAPNDFGSYMHDTPDKKLFLLSDREKSNGCVRVEKIMPLASLTMGHDPEGGDDEELNDAIATGKTQSLDLEEPVAVYMLYWTAMAGPDGAVQFRPDIYGRDALLIAKLGGGGRSAHKTNGAAAATAQ